MTFRERGSRRRGSSARRSAPDRRSVSPYEPDRTRRRGTGRTRSGCWRRSHQTTGMRAGPAVRDDLVGRQANDTAAPMPGAVEPIALPTGRRSSVVIVRPATDGDRPGLVDPLEPSDAPSDPPSARVARTSSRRAPRGPSPPPPPRSIGRRSPLPEDLPAVHGVEDFHGPADAAVPARAPSARAMPAGRSMRRRRSSRNPGNRVHVPGGGEPKRQAHGDPAGAAVRGATPATLPIPSRSRGARSRCRRELAPWQASTATDPPASRGRAREVGSRQRSRSHVEQVRFEQLLGAGERTGSAAKNARRMRIDHEISLQPWASERSRRAWRERRLASGR